MASLRKGDKALSEPMMSYVAKAYKRLSASMSWTPRDPSAAYISIWQQLVNALEV